MTITTRYPTTDIAVSGTWTNPTGVQAAGGTSATITMANRNTTFERQQAGYGFDSVIPAGAVINSVQIEVMHSVSTTSSVAFLENLAYINTTAGAVNSDNTEPTTLTARTYANYARPGGGSWTRDDLLDGTFKTGLRSREGNSTVSCTFSYDYIRVTVDWSLPALSATASVQLTDLVGASAGTVASSSVPAKAAVSWVAFQAPLGEAVGTASPTLEGLTRAVSGKVRVKGTTSRSLGTLTGTAGSIPAPAQLAGNRKLAEMVTVLTQSPAALARFTPTITGAVYHVAKNGSDSNPGTEAQPFLTINKGWWAVAAGGVCYVHDGVYAERPYCDRSGTSDTSMINVIAYPGDNPVLDARTLGLAGSTAYIIIQGDYTYFSGFEVRNSGGWGIKIYGNHSVVDSCQVHDCQNNGIFISGDYSTAQYNKVWHTCLDNYGGTNTTWASACSAGRGRTGADTTYYATLRGNEVWENWGEGVSCYESSNTLIENNISHDNFTGNIYISDSAYVTVRQNLVYCLPTSIMYNNSYAANVGIMIGSELHLPDITDITVVNNIVYGCYRNLYWFLNSSHTNDHMNNILIANNTFVNSANEPGFANVHMSNGLVAHVNTAFKNNIVVQDDSVPIIYQPSSITYSGNVYSKTPSILGTGDIVADPKLSRIGSPYLTEYYNILLDSPAIGRASTLTDNTVDYFNFTRSAPYDSGAAEYIRPLPKAQGTVITPQGISGAAAQTLSGLTRSAAGKVFAKASSSATLGSLGRSAVARALGKGTAASTLSWVTSTAVGKAFDKGTTAKSLAEMTSTAQAKARANGTSSKTLDAVTRTAAAKAYVKGSVAQALAGLARSAAAKVFGKGTSSATLSGLTGAGSAKARANATQSKSLAVLTSASAAKLLGKGAASKTLVALTGTGVAKAQVKGAGAQTLASLSVYASSSSAHIGTANSTLAGVTATSAVKTPIRATAGKTLGALVSSVVAKLTGKGTASSTLASVGRSAAVKTTISGGGAKALATLTGHASTSAQTTLVTGQASSTLGQLSGTAQTKAQLKGTLNKVLASLANTGTIQARAGGSVSSVLAGLARSSTAVAPVRGAVSKAFAALSSAAAGTSKIVGTAASTLGSLTSSSSAKPQTSAQASRTFDPLIGTASVKSTIAGKVLRTLGQLTSAAGAKVASVGTANRSLGTLTTSTSGKVHIVGTASRSLGQLVASSGVMSSSKGTASSTLGQLVATATGKARAAATVTRTLGQIVTSASARSRAGGSSSKTLAAVSGAAVAQGRAAGVVSRTLAVLTAGAQVVSTISGRAVSTLGQLRSTVSGGVKNEGTASATLSSLRSFAIAGSKGSTSVIAPSAIARARASIPTVSASRNVSITAETARAFATAKVAQVSTSTNVSVETATARATAQTSTPVVTTTSNVRVVVPAARATAKATAASVSTSVTVTTSARATAKAAQPTVTVGVSASINAPSGHAVARTTSPQVTVGVSITITPQVGRSFARAGLPLVSTTRNVVVQATAARAWARAAAPRFADFGTPASRVYRLPAGNRVHRLAALDTTYTIPFEDRVIKVVDEGSE